MSNTRESLLINRHFADLNPIVHGRENCVSGHTYGPAVRNYTLIHYIVSGCGTYTVGGKSYTVSAGDAFRILPGELTVYSADRDDPWEYRWIGFDGALSGRFAQLPPVLTLPEMVFGRMMHLSSQPSITEYLLAGELFSLYAHLFTDNPGGNPHVRRVENYIRSNYMYPIRVERIAGELGLDRRYLSRLFKETAGCSIQEYLIRVRLEEAERLLLRGCSVKEAARLTGYDDVSNFSKLFKKRTGKTPISIIRK